MKVTRFSLLLIVAAVLGFASCSSIASDLMRGAIIGSAGSGSSGGGSAAHAAPAVADFQSGEVLASHDNGKIEDAAFFVAKVLQQASPATKNQAEVIYIEDGKKYWVNFIVESRKADKSDFKVGATLLYLRGWASHDNISADTYRKSRWDLGNVTSIENLYKNQVEIDGENYNINYLRTPTTPIK